MSEYPEHDKLKAIADESQAIHDFLEWCETLGLHLAERYCVRWEHEERCGEDDPCDLSDRMLPTNRSQRGLLAEFFKIDMNVIENEKRAMLGDLARAQEQRLIDQMRSHDA